MFLTLFKKELIMELRSKQMILSMLVFGLSIILIVALSTNVSKVILMNYSPGLFWLMNLFIVVLAVHRSFNYEKEFDAFTLMITSPVDRGMIFVAKWMSGVVFISTTQLIILVPFFKLLLLDIPHDYINFLFSAFLANFAIMAIASLVSGIVVRSNYSDILLPILLFPLLSPIIIAATKISESIIHQVPFSQWNIWVLIVVSVIVIFGLSGYALFEYVVEE
tara:strand:+ start:1558 stop:2220 length:663 start_codon:yes stop_codon:yes gene_type:complete